MLSLLTDVPAVLYRQDILRDCIDNAAIVRRLYALTVETIERERKHYWGVSSRNPGFLLHSAVDVLQMFVEMLRRLRQEADAHAGRFRLRGLHHPVRDAAAGARRRLSRPPSRGISRG